MTIPPDDISSQQCAGDPPDGLINLIDPRIVCLYRYHLVCSGDPTPAEGRTARTVQAAREALSTPGQAVLRADEPWLWRLAMRTRGEAPASFSAAANPTGPADFIDVETESLRFQRALIPQVTLAFERLSRRQAEILALRLFGGLSADQTATVTDRSPAAVDKEYQQGLLRLVEILSPDRDENSAGDASQMEAELLSLAERIQPDPRFLSSLSEQLRLPLPAPSDNPPAGAAWPAAAGANLRRYLWIPVVVAGMILFAFNIWAQPPRITTAPTPIQTQAPAAGKPIPVTSSGYLQPVSQDACQEIQSAIVGVLHLQTSLTLSAPFIDPVVIEEDRNGSGCEIRATGTGEDFRGIDQTIQTIIPLLVARGYQVDGQFGSNSACPTCYQFPNDWFGKGLLFNRSDGRAILSVGWRPVDSHLCPTPNAEGSCSLPPSAQSYSLRLNLANDPARQTLLAFFQRWQAGSNGALDYLAEDLHNRLSNLSELDTLAGLQQSQLATAQVSWRIRQTSNKAIQLFVNIHPPATSANSYPSPISRLAISMASTQGTWRIDNIWRMDFFESSRDSAFIADSQGRILALSTTNGSTVALTDANFYLPTRDPNAALSADQVRLSPDGKWLAISMPVHNPGGSTADTPTSGQWLISTGGGGAQQIDQQPLHLAWGPDSQQIAYVSPRDGQAILIYNITTRARSVLTRARGPIRGLAWSPDGKHLAVTFIMPDKSAEQSPRIGIDLTVINSSSGHDDLLVEFPGLDPEISNNPDLEMSWTGTGSEIWLLPARAAVNLATHNVSPLVASSPSAEALFQPSAAASSNTSLAQVSPNGAMLAKSFTASYQGSANWVAIHSVGPSSTSGDQDPILHPIGKVKVAALEWTEDSQALILAGGVDDPQPIWRMDPTSGQTQLLAHHAFYLGLRSRLLRESQHIATQAQATPITDASGLEGLVRVSIPAFQMSLRVPAWWRVTQPDIGGAPAVVSSVGFSSAGGLANVHPDQLVLEISQREQIGIGGIPMERPWPLTDGHPISAWTTIHLGDTIAYQLTYPVWPGGPDVIEIPHAGLVTTITKYPAASFYDPRFEQMLQSLTFDP